MGKGVAYQFKRAYKEMFKDYAARCKNGLVELGEVYSFRESGKVIINFPTKGHWKSRSKLEDIESGLVSLRALLIKEDISSVAIPPLGCGNGGLEWCDVSFLIEKHLSNVPVNIQVYRPKGVSFKSRVFQAPKLSLSHYICLDLRSKLPSNKKIIFHKVAYFAEQISGERGYFDFVGHKYGPWSKSIDHVMKGLVDYIDATGLSPEDYASLVDRAESVDLDGKSSVKLRVWRSAVDTACSLAKSEGLNLEVAATVYEIVLTEPGIEEIDVVDRFFSWSKEKQPRFKSEDVFRSLRILENEGYLTKTLAGLQASAPEI